MYIRTYVRMYVLTALLPVSMYVFSRAVRWDLKFAYHDTIVRGYTLGIDNSHDMAYMR